MIIVEGTWMFTLGVINLVLLIIGLLVFLPKKVYKRTIAEFIQVLKNHFPLLLLIFGIVFVHLIEINFIDAYTTEWVRIDFAEWTHLIEKDIVFSISAFWTPAFVTFFVIMYIAVYPFTLWFSPLYYLMTDDKKTMKTLAYGLLIIYAGALPFYLFLPVTNVYRYYSLESALETIIPTVEQFFYATTTQNNCFPSLHTSMTILIAWCAHLSGNKKLEYFAYFCMVSVIIAVVYLAIHWIIDIIGGVILVIVAIFLLNRFIKD